MKRRELLPSILRAVAFGVVSDRMACAQEELDPLKVTPDTHKLLFENDFVRVIESKVPVGGVEPKHRHPHCVTVSLADFEAEIKAFPDGKTTRVHRTFGSVAWSEATIHEVKIVGRAPSHNVRVELKQ